MDKTVSRIEKDKNKIADYAKTATESMAENKYLSEKRDFLLLMNKEIKIIFNTISKNKNNNNDNSFLIPYYSSIIQKIQGKSENIVNIIKSITNKTNEIQMKIIEYESNENIEKMKLDNFVVFNMVQEKKNFLKKLDDDYQKIKKYYYIQERVREKHYETINQKQIKKDKSIENVLKSLKRELQKSNLNYKEKRGENGFTATFFNSRLNCNINLDVQSFSSDDSMCSSDTDYSIDELSSNITIEESDKKTFDSKNSSNSISFNSNGDLELKKESNKEENLSSFNESSSSNLLLKELNALKKKILELKKKNKNFSKKVTNLKNNEKKMKNHIKKLNDLIKLSSINYFGKLNIQKKIEFYDNLREKKKKEMYVAKSTSVIPFVSPIKEG